MLKQERHKEILRLLEEKKYLSMIELAAYLNVSDMTIRRDITELEKKKKLKKLYGGAQNIDVLSQELSTDEKSQTNIEQKKYIGKIMNDLIQDDSIIFIGAGTTIFYALKNITKKNLFIVTNSLIAFTYLKEHTDYRLLLTGGEFYPRTEEFIGEVAIRSFKHLNIDIAFASTNGAFEDNVTTSHFDEGAVQNAAFARSKKTCIVADSSKLGVSDIYTFTHLTEHDYLITDDKISDEQLITYGKFTTILYQTEG